MSVGKTGMSDVQQSQIATAPFTTAGAAEGGYLKQNVDAKESATAPKFGDIYKQIQAKYGEKADKPREIKKTLGKDDFLKIMVTQMKNQDPTNPFKAEQMAAEIAQFTSVEQLQNVNQNLAKMATQNRPVEQMAMTNLIGKVVTVDRERFPHLEGQSEVLNFNLPQDASSVRVTLISEGGEVVLEKDIGAQKAGEASFTWDGLKSNTLPAKAGNFMFRIDAKDDKGRSVETNPRVQARVIGVSFEGSDPVFLVGDAQHQDKVTLKNIVRIEVDNGQLAAGKSSTAGASAPAKTSNFFEFKKGVGSGPVIPMPIGMNEVKAEEKGFPNGLHESESPKIEPEKNSVTKGGEQR